MTVLVVEDERDIRNLIVLHLEQQGFRCRTAGTGLDALRDAKAQPPDLILLDLMLPELDGLEVCRRLRADAATARTPIIMLTAKADEIDRVVGLEVGADDYVVKPFSPKELVARVRAVLRRMQRGAAARRLAVGRLVLDVDRHQVESAGVAVDLAPREFALLQALLEAPDRVLTRDYLLAHAWGYAHADEIESRTVDVHVRRLRVKLGPEGRRITTVKGVGYKLETDESSPG